MRRQIITQRNCNYCKPLFNNRNNIPPRPVIILRENCYGKSQSLSPSSPYSCTSYTNLWILLHWPSMICDEHDRRIVFLYAVLIWVDFVCLLCEAMHCVSIMFSYWWFVLNVMKMVRRRAEYAHYIFFFKFCLLLDELV